MRKWNPHSPSSHARCPGAQVIIYHPSAIGPDRVMERITTMTDMVSAKVLRFIEAVSMLTYIYLIYIGSVRMKMR